MSRTAATGWLLLSLMALSSGSMEAQDTGTLKCKEAAGIGGNDTEKLHCVVVASLECKCDHRDEGCTLHKKGKAGPKASCSGGKLTNRIFDLAPGEELEASCCERFPIPENQPGCNWRFALHGCADPKKEK